MKLTKILTIAATGAAAVATAPVIGVAVAIFGESINEIFESKSKKK